MMNFLKRFKAGDPIHEVLGVDNLRHIINILENIQGVGCVIEKPTNADGRGWRIVVNKRMTDGDPDVLDPEMDSPDLRGDEVLPFDVYLRKNADGVNEKEVSDDDAQVRGLSGDWTDVSSYVPFGKQYLKVYDEVVTSTKTSNPSDVWSDYAQILIQESDGTSYPEKWKYIHRYAHGNQYFAFIRGTGDKSFIGIAPQSWRYAVDWPWTFLGWKEISDWRRITITKALVESGDISLLVSDDYDVTKNHDAQPGTPAYATRHCGLVHTDFLQVTKSWAESFVYEFSLVFFEYFVEGLCDLVARLFREEKLTLPVIGQIWCIAGNTDHPDIQPYPYEWKKVNDRIVLPMQLVLKDPLPTGSLPTTYQTYFERDFEKYGDNDWHLNEDGIRSAACFGVPISNGGTGGWTLCDNISIFLKHSVFDPVAQGVADALADTRVVDWATARQDIPAYKSNLENTYLVALPAELQTAQGLHSDYSELAQRVGAIKNSVTGLQSRVAALQARIEAYARTHGGA